MEQSYSVMDFLEDHSSDIYNSFLITKRPITGGEDYLKRAHIAPQARRDMNKLFELEEKKEKLLDLLTDIVSGSKLDKKTLDEMSDRIEAQIEKVDAIHSIFEELNRSFRSLDVFQQRDVLRLSISKLIGLIKGIRADLAYQLTHVEYLEPIFVVAQVFSIAEKLLEKSFDNFRKKKERYYFGVIAVLLLRVEALKREKIDIHDLDEDIAILSELLEEPPFIVYNDSIFELLA